MGCRDCLSTLDHRWAWDGLAMPQVFLRVPICFSAHQSWPWYIWQGNDPAASHSMLPFPFFWGPPGSEEIKLKSSLIWNSTVSFCSSSIISKKTWSIALANTERSASSNSPQSSPNTILCDCSPPLFIYLLMLPLYLYGCPSALECRNVFAAAAPANIELSTIPGTG